MGLSLALWLRAGEAAPPLGASVGPAPPPTQEGSLRREYSTGRSLTLQQVIDALDASHPLLGSADAKIDEAEGKITASRGAFDPKVVAEGQLNFMPEGKYTNQIAGVKVEALTPWYGLGAYAGWRIGLGNFPIYDGKRITGTGGELRAGLNLPLWRDGIIDFRRAALRKAEMSRDAAALGRELKRLELEQKAAKSYFDWVAADRKLEVDRGLLMLAEVRDEGIRRQVDRGNLAAIEAVDNRRQVLNRRGRVIEAERSLREKSLELSLYARDAQGRSLVPAPDTNPHDFPAERDPSFHDVESDVAQATELRPELALFRLQRDMAEVDLRLARNQRAPNIDVRGEVAKDLGQVEAAVDPLLFDNILPLEFGVGVMVSIPIPMRKARGDLASARARQRQAEFELAFAAEQVEVQIRQAHAAWRAAYEQLKIARENTEANESLAQAERLRFERGDSDLLRINLREVSAASAAKDEVDAHARYHQAFADYMVATGVGLSGGI